MYAHPLFRPLAVATAVVVLGLSLMLIFAPGAWAGLEGLSLELVQRAANASAEPGVVWAASDDGAVDTGRLRSQIARAIDAATQAGARAIVVAVPLAEPSDSADLARVRSFLDAAETSPDAELRARLLAWVQELDHDGDVERALRAAGNAVLLGSVNAPPLDRFVAAAHGVGYEPAAAPDADGVTRRDRLYVVEPGGAARPSLTFAAWLASRGQAGAPLADRPLSAIASELRAGRGPWLSYYGRRAGEQGGTARIGLAELARGGVPKQQLAHQIVVLGGGQTSLAVPTGPGLTLGEALTQRIASLESDSYATLPHFARIATLLALLGTIAWAALLAPHLRPAARFTVSLLVVLGLFALEVGLLAGLRMWLPLAAAAALLPFATLAVALTPERAERPVRRPEPVVPPSPVVRVRPAPVAPVRRTTVPPPPEAAAAEESVGSTANRPHSLKEINAVLDARRDEPTRTEVADLLLGRSKRPPKPHLGRYELERELGRGAMGTVYLGRDPRINRVLAVKAIPIAEEFTETDLAEARERFFREAEMAGRLKHPGIVTVYDAGEDNGIAWIAMEYVQGRMLSDFTMSDQLLPPASVFEVAARIADALDYAHQQDVVHRDIKPANVLFDPATLDIKITDFGIARLTNSSSTRSGIVLGTPSFMAPERLEGRNVTGRSDLFALGVTLFQMLAGQLPFRADSMAGLMEKIAHAPHPPLKTIRPDLPPCASLIVDRALQKDPAQRFATGGEMARVLRACARALDS